MHPHVPKCKELFFDVPEGDHIQEGIAQVLQLLSLSIIVNRTSSPWWLPAVRWPMVHMLPMEGQGGSCRIPRRQAEVPKFSLDRKKVPKNNYTSFML